VTHPPEFTDTDPRALEVWRNLLRSKTPGERLMMALQLSEMAIRMSEAGVRTQYPNASEREVFLRAAARRLPRDLMIRAYGWDPESDAHPV
jgi:predicted RNA-binding Zn ribbon-like protein